MTVLPRSRVIWLLLGLPIVLLLARECSASAQNWNDLLSRFADAGGCRWEPKEYAECTAGPKEFEQIVKRVINAPDLHIAVIQDSEFNSKQTPKVLVGIRCAPIHYFLSLQGAMFGLGGQQVNETTQLYIQLLEPERGVGHLRILSRSAQYTTGSAILQALPGAPNGSKTARTIKDRILTVIDNLNNPR